MFYIIYIYHLVMTNIAMENPPMFKNGKPSITGPFSMAMLNNQRVNIYIYILSFVSHATNLFPLDSAGTSAIFHAALRSGEVTAVFVGTLQGGTLPWSERYDNLTSPPKKIEQLSQTKILANDLFDLVWNYKLANPKKDGKHGFIMDLALFLKWECPFLSFFTEEYKVVPPSYKLVYNHH